MPTSFRSRMALIILLAVVVRLAFVIAVDKGKLRIEHNPDAEDYLSFAYNLATGVGFAHAINESQPFSQPVEFSAWRTPLYPMFLSLAFHVSRNAFFLQSLQVALAALSLYFFLRLGLILFGEVPALIAGLVFALYPPLIFYTVELTTEGLFLVLLIAALFVFYRTGGELSSARVFCLGVLTGLAALCRPNGLMLIPAIGLAMWLTERRWGQTVRRMIVLTLAVAIIILPWTYRNYRLYHKFVLISTNGGANLWFGAHFRLDPGATMAEIGYSQHQAFRDVPEPEREKYYYRQAFAILDHSPRLWGEMFASNFTAMYTLMPSAKLHSFTSRILYSICYVPILFSGIAGWILLRRRWRELSLLWGWVAADTFLYCIYVARYVTGSHRLIPSSCWHRRLRRGGHSAQACNRSATIQPRSVSNLNQAQLSASALALLERDCPACGSASHSAAAVPRAWLRAGALQRLPDALHPLRADHRGEDRALRQARERAHRHNQHSFSGALRARQSDQVGRTLRAGAAICRGADSRGQHQRSWM